MTTQGCEVCQRCGQPYATVYRVQNHLWERITGRSDGGGVLCPTCLDSAARQQGMTLYWQACEDEFPEPPGSGTKNQTHVAHD